jgi:transcriptional activator HAC1
MEDLFNFDHFPEHDGSQSTSSPLDVASDFASSFFDDLAPNTYGLSEPFDAKCFDLQTTSGAANASDGVIASEH